MPQISADLMFAIVQDHGEIELRQLRVRLVRDRDEAELVIRHAEREQDLGPVRSDPARRAH